MPAHHRRKNREEERQMDFIPEGHRARTLSEDDGTLCVHKQPIIMMMNGRGQMAIVSLSLLYMPAYQYEMDHQIAAHCFLQALVNSLSN